MPDPFERSISAAEQSCEHINGILNNCVKSGEQPNQETINGITAALDALRSAEGKLLDRINKDSVRDAKTIYS